MASTMTSNIPSPVDVTDLNEPLHSLLLHLPLSSRALCLSCHLLSHSVAVIKVSVSRMTAVAVAVVVAHSYSAPSSWQHAVQ